MQAELIRLGSYFFHIEGCVPDFSAFKCARTSSRSERHSSTKGSSPEGVHVCVRKNVHGHCRRKAGAVPGAEEKLTRDWHLSGCYAGAVPRAGAPEESGSIRGLSRLPAPRFAFPLVPFVPTAETAPKNSCLPPAFALPQRSLQCVAVAWASIRYQRGWGSGRFLSHLECFGVLSFRCTTSVPQGALFSHSL